MSGFKYLAVSFLLVAGSGPAQAACYADNPDCFTKGGGDSKGVWRFQNTPPDMGGIAKFPNTCTRADLRFLADGTLELLSPRFDGGVATNDNAARCQQVLQEDCKGNPNEPIRWSVNFDESFNEYRLVLKKCQLSRSYAALFGKTADGRASLVLGTSIADSAGEADVPQFLWESGGE